MDSLPSEVLCKIFLNTVVGIARDLSFDEYAAFATPFWISHVSRRWRSESLSFGKLWSYLTIDQTDKQVPKLKYIFDTSLQRTKECPLYFRLSGYLGASFYEPDERAHRLAEYMITSMLSQQHRWREVDLYWSSLIPSPGFQGIHATNMPMLLSLRLGGEFHKGEEERAFVTVNLAQSRQLEELELSGNFILHAGEEPICNLRKQCSLYYRGGHSAEAGYDVYLDFLKKTAPNLEKLDVSILYDDEEADTVPSHEHVLERIRTLSLQSGISSPIILRSLTLPALTELTYEEEYTNEGIGGEALLNFVQRTMPSLTRLEVEDYAVHKNTLIPALRLLPTLQELRISNTAAPGWLFEALTLKDATPSGQAGPRADDIICPRLELFHLIGAWTERGDLSAYCEMLASRWKVLRTLGTVWFKDGSKELKVPITSDEDYLRLETHFGNINDISAGVLI